MAIKRWRLCGFSISLCITPATAMSHARKQLFSGMPTCANSGPLLLNLIWLILYELHKHTSWHKTNSSSVANWMASIKMERKTFSHKLACNLILKPEKLQTAHAPTRSNGCRYLRNVWQGALQALVWLTCWVSSQPLVCMMMLGCLRRTLSPSGRWRWLG